MLGKLGFGKKKGDKNPKRKRRKHRLEESSEDIDDKPKSILMSMISQLRVGMDLSKVTLPTFILEPRSFLEKMTDQFLHPDTLFAIQAAANPEQRLIATVTWFLSGYHFKPIKGVKKPYNPILGEHFYARWNHGDNGESQFIAEQVSHHPPISCFHFTNRKSNICIDGSMHPRSKFLGNSAASILDGTATLHLLDKGESYVITFPAYYVKGVVVGKLAMEIGGKTTIKCEATGLTAELEFKTKGMVFGRGNENAFAGKITEGKNTLYTMSGWWDDAIDIVDERTKEQRLMFDVLDWTTDRSMAVRAEEHQDEWESRKLWDKVTKALMEEDQDGATTHKTALEDDQRAAAKARAEAEEELKNKYFTCIDRDAKQWQFVNINLAKYSDGETRVALDGRDDNIPTEPSPSVAPPRAAIPISADAEEVVDDDNDADDDEDA